jgi:predicted nucleic acid-binding protein
MKLPDVNIWLALALSGHSHHRAARTWLDEQDAASSIFSAARRNRFFCDFLRPQRC